MSDVSTWRTNAAANNMDPPDGFPEGMDRPAVNNATREMMAAIRRWYDDPQWLDLMRNAATGAVYTVSRQSDTQIKISGANVTGYFNTSRRVKLTGGASPQFGVVVTASFSTDTLVTLTLDSGVVDAATNHVDLHAIADLKTAVEKSLAPLTQGKHTVWIPAGAIRPTSAKGASGFTAIATGTDQPDIHGLPFQDALAATGQILFTGLPTDGQTITINGKLITFTTGASGTDNIQIAGTAALMATNLATFLNAHADGGIAAATYADGGSGLVTVTHDTPGYGGNAFAMSETAANTTCSATLTGGSDEQWGQFQIGMPKSWNEGTVSAIIFGIHQGSTGSAVFELQGVAIGAGEALGVAYGTAVQITFSSVAANQVLKSAESGAVTLAGPPAEGDMAVFRIGRKPLHGSDTLASAFILLGVMLFLQYVAPTDA